MSIDVHHATQEDLDRWNDLVEQSPHGTPFHLHEFGTVSAEHAGAEYRPLVGFKGQEPVGLFPTFEISRGPVTTVFSPPPNLKITYSGPAMVNLEKLKQRKAQRRTERFVTSCMERLDSDLNPNYTHFRTGWRYRDTRPFVRHDFDATPRHTYVVDIAGDEEELLGRFSSDARQNVRGEYDDVQIAECGVAAARSIVQQVRARHEEQNEPFPVTPEYAVDLFGELPDGAIRPYVCRVDGDVAGGMLALELDDTIYRWIGGAKHDENVPVNDLLDWHIMCDARSRGVTRYDLVGAQHPTIAKYKAKFAPELELYQRLERGTLMMQLASRLYQRVYK